MAFLAALLLFFAPSCRPGTEAGRFFAYLDAPFQADFEGTIDGMNVAFLLETSGARPAGSVRGVSDFTVTFKSPEALRGLCVGYSANDEGFVARLDTLEIPGDYSRLCAPALAFLTEDAVASTERGQDTVTAKTQGGLSLIFHDATGYPCGFCGIFDGRALDFRVTFREAAGN